MITPRHEYDRNYVAVPDLPRASMIDMERLPVEVQEALRLVREYEANGAAWPTLLTDPVRAWFRHEQRKAEAAA